MACSTSIYNINKWESKYKNDKIKATLKALKNNKEKAIE
jgi:hypothetical protein